MQHGNSDYDAGYKYYCHHCIFATGEQNERIMESILLSISIFNLQN
jgi:hypothetical protein